VTKSRKVVPAQRSPGAGTVSSRLPDPAAESPDVTELRELARRGVLAGRATAASGLERKQLRGAAYAVAYRVVYEAVTRRVEWDRGHGRCAQSIQQLEPACLDRYYDDVESAVEHLLTRAVEPIENLEAWLAHWAPKAAVDGYRRRRGERGALQRPRMTKTLAAGLGHDPWLEDLALGILEWVGVTATAGAGLWPVQSWALRRAQVKGDPSAADPVAVAGEVEQVLAVMRRQPIWYADHVERPLGRKVAPVAAPPGDEAAEPRPLRLVPEHEVDEARLIDLAWTATEAIQILLRRGEDPVDVVTRVLMTVFTGGTGGEELDRTPGSGPSSTEHVSALLADAAGVANIVPRVLHILGLVQE